MGFAELILTGAALAADAFAVSVCKGLNMKKINFTYAVIIAAFFGIFQGVMPLLGWAAGVGLRELIVSIDHWITFALLSAIGIKAIIEAVKDNESEEEKTFVLDIKELFLLAIATSIDAFAVGISFAFLEVNIVLSVVIIAAVTFVFCFAGVIIGNKFGAGFKNKAEIAGGIVLICIGIKVLLEHLF